MKKLSPLLLVVAICAFGSLGAAALWRGGGGGSTFATPSGSAEPSTVPVTVVRKLVATDSSTSAAGPAQEIVAFRGDGSVAEERRFFAGDGALQYRIRGIKITGGITVEGADDRAKVMSVTKRPNGDIQRARERWNPAEQCVATFGGTKFPPGTIITKEELAGHETYKIVSDYPAMRVTVWRAPSLNCADLRSTVEKKNADGTIASTTDSAPVSVVLGEPDASLFEIPWGYANVSPTERYRRVALICCGSVDPQVLESLRPFDEPYAKHCFDIR